MILIIGGAYQGKTAYAKQTYGLQDADIFTCEGLALDPAARCVRHLERFALACVQAGKEPADELRALDLSDKILLCEDISCGVVPIDPEQRAWREAVGRMNAMLAARAERVTPAHGAEGMRHLTLIRHGLTEGNVRRWYYGALDLPLCEAGADALREAAAAGLYPPIGQAKILTSGLLRTDQTLRLLYGDVPHEVWPELREISFGIFEGKSYDELNGRADYAAWLAGDWFGNVPPGGESFAQAQARILAGLARMQAQGEDILAVVHGGTVLTIMQALFPEEEKNGYEWQPRPGGGYRLDLEAHTWTPIGIQL